MSLIIASNYHSAAVENYLTLVCLYALAQLGQVTYWNSFGFDRGAVQAYFAWPAPISRALVGKNLAAAVFVFLEMVAVTTACLLLRMAPSPNKILEAYLVTPVVALYLLAAGNLAGLGCVVYWIALDSAVKTAEERKERIIGILSQNDGPVMTE